MNCYKQLFSIAAIIVWVGSSLSMDTGVLVKASDNKECTLPQWKIEESRLLHTKQQWQLFKEKYDKVSVAPIQLKTICSQKLELFSQALDVHDFLQYFENLTQNNKRLLICAAGEQELDSPVLTQNLVKTYLGLELCECINTHVPIAEVVNHLRYLVIHDNCQHKNFAQKRGSYLGNHCCVAKGIDYVYLPDVLQDQTNFSGSSLPTALNFFEGSDKGSNDRWVINNLVRKPKQAFYFFTAIDPVNSANPCGKRSNKEKLWAKQFNQGNNCLEKIIEHTNLIQLNAFSKDGNYFATTSDGLRSSELMLSNLAIQDDKFIGPDVFLTDFDGIIDWISFTNRSNVLVALSGKKIYFWDVQTSSLVTAFDCSVVGQIECMGFNHDDSRLAIASFDATTQVGTVALCDISDITKIIHIRSITLPDLFVSTVEFTPFGDELIIGTNQSAMLLNGYSGDIIMDLGSIKEKSNTSRDWVRAIRMKDMPFLVTTAHASNNESNVALWDINSGKCVATVLEKEKELVGIGVTSDCCSIISTTKSFDMIKTDLYDDAVAGCLKWVQDKMNLFQKYILLRLYRASKIDDSANIHLDSPEQRILESLGTEQCNVKELVEKYLLKK